MSFVFQWRRGNQDISSLVISQQSVSSSDGEVPMVLTPLRSPGLVPGIHCLTMCEIQLSILNQSIINVVVPYLRQ